MPICSPDAAFHSHTVLTGGHIGVLGGPGVDVGDLDAAGSKNVHLQQQCCGPWAMSLGLQQWSGSLPWTKGQSRAGLPG